jgi:hypothetical protein
LFSSPLLSVDRLLVLAKTKCLIWRMTAVALYACCKPSDDDANQPKTKNKEIINKSENPTQKREKETHQYPSNTFAPFKQNAHADKWIKKTLCHSSE